MTQEELLIKQYAVFLHGCIFTIPQIEEQLKEFTKKFMQLYLIDTIENKIDSCNNEIISILDKNTMYEFEEDDAQLNNLTGQLVVLKWIKNLIQ